VHEAVVVVEELLQEIGDAGAGLVATEDYMH
jgi:hypothetical protein